MSQDDADVLARHQPGLPIFPASEGLVKVSAGWLIDRLDWRGVERNGVKSLMIMPWY